ncbi:hypothetical protein C7M84_007421 [Penaeus vannamei]|uniref:Uncharacterized protein n=1 Tax=Penaeus vannamei TaxID=6689 RepID=A0A3R7QBZ9_PENVA|nr:hypothetical protein C7M84_007421 [Penaeus vannamei]
MREARKTRHWTAPFPQTAALPQLVGPLPPRHPLGALAEWLQRPRVPEAPRQSRLESPRPSPPEGDRAASHDLPAEGHPQARGRRYPPPASTPPSPNLSAPTRVPDSRLSRGTLHAPLKSLSALRPRQQSSPRPVDVTKRSPRHERSEKQRKNFSIRERRRPSTPQKHERAPRQRWTSLVDLPNSPCPCLPRPRLLPARGSQGEASRAVASELREGEGDLFFFLYISDFLHHLQRQCEETSSRPTSYWNYVERTAAVGWGRAGGGDALPTTPIPPGHRERADLCLRASRPGPAFRTEPEPCCTVASAQCHLLGSRLGTSESLAVPQLCRSRALPRYPAAFNTLWPHLRYTPVTPLSYVGHIDVP